MTATTKRRQQHQRSLFARRHAHGRHDAEAGVEGGSLQHEESRRTTIITAIASNLFIAVVKLIVAAMTGSAAMLAEGIHSVVDTGNAVLITVGVRLAKRPADERFPFGRGKELFFWSLIVAMCIFAVGGGVSVVEGIARIRKPHDVESSLWAFGVLAVSAVAEGISLRAAVRGLREYQRQHLPTTTSTVSALQRAKDPSVFSVLLEDSAALTGLAIAFAGLLATKITGNPIFDGLASIGVGVVLAFVAVVLASECRSLLVGERALRPVVDGVRAIAADDPDVDEVVEVKTMQIGADDVLLALRLRFRTGGDAVDAVAAIARISTAIRAKFDAVHGVLIDADSFIP